MESIADRIKISREKSLKTQDYVAKALGMSRSTYARREANGDFSSKILEDMANIFDVSVNYLICGNMNNENTQPPQYDLLPKEYISEPEPQRAKSTELNLTEDTEDFRSKITHEEINTLKIIRNLSPADSAELKKFLEEKLKK